MEVDVPEWLSGMTRNHVGSARAGSNPAVHDFFLIFIPFVLFPSFVIRILKDPNYLPPRKIEIFNDGLKKNYTIIS